jgi:TonB family protein
VARWLYFAAAPLAFGLVLLFSQRSAIAASMPELHSLLNFATDEGKNSPAEVSGTIAVAAPVISGGDPDTPPIFEGCENEPAELRKQCSDKKLVNYILGGKIDYPDEARKKGIQGTVVVQFVVDATGKVTNVEVSKGIGGGCDEAVLRVLREMPRWTPGVKDGRKVDVRFYFPVQFKLDGVVSNEGSLEELNFSDGILLDKHTISYTDANPIWFFNGKRLTSNEAQELINSGKGGDILEITNYERAYTLVGEEAQNATVLIILPKEEMEGQRAKTVYYVNGKSVAEQEALILLNSRSEQIKHIEVLIGEKAISLAGEKGKNGVTSITLYAPGENRLATSGTPSPSAGSEEIFKRVEEMPRFPGCEDDVNMSLEAKKGCADKKMLEFVYDNIRYPAQARNAGVQGIVVVSFIIEKDGSITNPQVTRGIGGGCDEESLRIVNMMPRWIAGKQRGRDVRVQFHLPVRYKLDSSTPVAGNPSVPSSSLDGVEVFKIVEEMPRFPGCEDDANLSREARSNCAAKKMLEFVYNNIRYPAQAREAAIEGTVVISFIVETDGTITEPRVLRDIGGGCGDEALRVANLMPRWIPGKQRGRPVRTQFNLPVRYKLDSAPAPAAEPAGKQTLKLEDFKLFPNPTDGKFTLQFSAPAKPTLIQVRDMQGREVLKRNLSRFSGAFREELNLGKAPKGEYVVVISQGNLVYTANLVRL